MSFPERPSLLNGLLTGAAIAILALAAGGCGTTRRSLEKKVAELESRIVTLKSEKANLAARNAVLDDRVLVLETKQDGCHEDERRQRQLEVVHLTAENLAGEEEAAEATPAPEAPAAAGDGPRPILRLVGSGEPRPASSAARAPLAALSVPAGSADDLGVVPIDGPGAGTETGPEAMFQEGYRAYANGDHAAALDTLARFVKENPDHALADDALFWRAECYLAQGRTLKGIGELERLLRRYPGSDKGASALYRIGFAYDRLGDRGKAGEYYFKVVERYPGSEAARKASRRVATIREGGASGDVTPASAMR